MLKTSNNSHNPHSFSVADYFSLSRAFILFPILWNIETSPSIALAWYGIALWTDYIDGWVAKKTNIFSIYGQYLDPMSDIVLHLNLLLVFYRLDQIPLWLIVLFVFRFLSLTAMSYARLHSRSSIKSEKLRSSILGKASFFSIALLVFSLFTFENSMIPDVLIYCSGSILLFSLLDYIYEWKKT